MPKNTGKKTCGPCRHFRIGYIQNRNTQTEEKDHYPEDILSTNDAMTLAKWLLLFVMEVRKKRWHGVITSNDPSPTMQSTTDHAAPNNLLGNAVALLLN